MRLRTRLVGLLVLFLLSSFLVSAEEGYFVVTYPADQEVAMQEHLQKNYAVELYLPEDKYLLKAERETLLEENLIHIETYYDFVGDKLLPEQRTDTYMVHLFKSANNNKVKDALRNNDIAILKDTGITLTVDSLPPLDLITSVEGISHVSAERNFQTFNMVTNQVGNTEVARSMHNLYGDNEIVAVADTGLDGGQINNNLHDDIEGRVISINHLGLIGSNPADEHGHGTHVTGTILGDGTLSGSDPDSNSYTNTYAGVAPKAQVIMQDIGGDDGTLSLYPPSPLTLMYTPAHQQGAKVHSNSWGSTGSFFYGYYDFWSQETDDFIHQNQDFSIIYAAGNFGTQGATTIVPPGLAKNTIAVGALDASTNQAAYFSGQGPTLDNRIKPDIMAPGMNVVSTISSLAVGCMPLSGNSNYCTMSGTSMATPHIAGLTALIRQYYQQERNHIPSAALLKATLISGADKVNGNPIPHFATGWGKANIVNALPKNKKNLAFFDENIGLTTGQEKTYTLQVRKNQPFVATLVWSDAKGPLTFYQLKQLVNDLDLEVQDAQGQTYASYDRDNNVEQVRIEQPKAGKYTLTVKGYTVPIGTQSYALAIRYADGTTQEALFTGETINCARIRDTKDC